MGKQVPDPIHDLRIVVLAGGKGARMDNELPKVLIPLQGRPIITHLLQAIQQSKIAISPLIVVGYQAKRVQAHLGDEYDYVYQARQLGTGHAVACCRSHLHNRAKHVLVLYGDHPLLSTKTIDQLVETHRQSRGVLTMATTKVDDFEGINQPFYDFGRVVRDASHQLVAIVEKKDATPDQLAIREVNPSYFCFQADWLWENVDQLNNQNAQKEYYLTDLLGLAIQQGQKISSVEVEPYEALGINTDEQLELVEQILKGRSTEYA